MNRPQKPSGLETPGLIFRRRATHWVLLWSARQDLVRRGYPLKVRRLWPYSEGPTAPEPTKTEWRSIASECQQLQDEMLAWSRGGAVSDYRALYNGTMASLIQLYLRDPDCPFQGLRFHTKHHYESHMATLTVAVGQAQIHALTFRDFKRWYEGFRKPKTAGGPERIARAHGLMTKVRILMSFGKLCEIGQCARASSILEEMTFELPRPRTAFITAEHADAIRGEAHRIGQPSIALAQAFAYELMLRQKDVVGEWIPVSEPGLSDVVAGSTKWMHGLHWSDIDANLILTKRISKSMRGRRAVLSQGSGKTEIYNLRSYPMIIQELAAVSDSKRAGPVIVCEYSGLPWRDKVFPAAWRKIANAVGVPKAVQNRDSRAGGITEATDQGAPLDTVRRHAGHSKITTTARYSRGHIEAKNEVARIRAAGRGTKVERG